MLPSMKPLIAALAAVCSLVAAASPAAGKAYSVDRIESVLVVDPDGSLHVSEHITFKYRGNFSFAYRDIPLKAGEHLADVGVSEDGIDYSMATNEEPGTFSLEQRNDVQRIVWHYRARNETRAFTLRYTLRGAVKRHADVAEIYVQFVGDQWDRRIGSVEARVRLPGRLHTGDVRAWAHGPLHGSVEVLGANELAFDIAPLPAHTFWEGRIVVPGAVFESVPVTGMSGRLEQILAEEEEWAEEANRRRDALRQSAEAASRERAREQARRPSFLVLAIALAVLGSGVWTGLFIRHGKPHAVTPLAPPGQVPSEHAPALLSYLLYRTVTGPALVATLLDLANRGYFEIRESVTQKTNWRGRTQAESKFFFERTPKDAADLARHEAELLDFLLSKAGNASGFSMKQLQDVASKRRSEFHQWFVKWGKRVEAAGTQAQFYEPYPTRAMVLNALMGVALVGAGILLSVLSASPVGLPAVVVGFLQAVLTGALQRRTPEGRRLLVEWRGFKRHLESISRALGPVSLDSQSWGSYLAAALIFGMHKKLLPLLRVAKEGAAPAAYPYWYHAALHGDSDGGLASLGSGFSSMVDAVSSTMSNASGIGGGGASAGGGGGSGGGGGGAG